MRLLLLPLCLALLLASCGKERIISPNDDGEIIEEAVNLRFTFDLSQNLLTIQNFNAAAVWVKVRRIENGEPGGILFNYFIWSQRTATRNLGLLQVGDEVVGTVWYFDIGESDFSLPADPDIWDFIQAVGGLLPFGSGEFRFTVGPD